MKSKSVLLLTGATLIGSVGSASMIEVKTTKDMVACLTSYIEHSVGLPANQISWEHEPWFIFGGKYFAASWRSRMWPNNGSVYLAAGPNNPPISCDLPTKDDGFPDYTQAGTCIATSTVDTQIEVRDEYYDAEDRRTVTDSVSIGGTIGAKIFCFNFKN